MFKVRDLGVFPDISLPVAYGTDKTRPPRATGQNYRPETVRLALLSFFPRDGYMLVWRELNMVQLLCSSELWSHRAWEACGCSRLVTLGCIYVWTRQDVIINQC